MNRATVVAGSSSLSRQLWWCSRHTRSTSSRSTAPRGLSLMRCNDDAILAIRGLLLVGDFSTTILTGGHVLRKCCNHSQCADLQLIFMPLGTLLLLDFLAIILRMTIIPRMKQIFTKVKATTKKKSRSR